MVFASLVLSKEKASLESLGTSGGLINELIGTLVLFSSKFTKLEPLRPATHYQVDLTTGTPESVCVLIRYIK
jgi:hypothetical protein